MLKTTSIFFLILLLTSCRNEPYACHCTISEVTKNDSILKSLDTEQGFPRFLSRYREIPLSTYGVETYRMSTRHSFNRYFQVYTITKTYDGADFLIQEFVSSKPYALDSKLSNKHLTKLNHEQWKHFKQVTENNCYWSLTVDDPDKSDYLDGGEWYIEGFQPNKRNCAHSYRHFIYRKTFYKQRQFYAIYTAFMDLVDTNQIHPL